MIEERVTVLAGEVRVDGERSPLLETGPRDADEAVVFVDGNPGSSRDRRYLLARVGPFASRLGRPAAAQT